MTTNDAVRALHRLGRREFYHGNWDGGIKCFSSVSHPLIRATLEECLDAQVELAKLLLEHRESIESECPEVIQRVCDILNAAELQIPSLLDPLNAPLTSDLVERVVLEGKLYYYQHQAWKEMDNEKLATLALSKGYHTSRSFLSRIVDQQLGQAHVERVKLWTVCLLTELVDFLDTRGKADEAYDLLRNENLFTSEILLCAKGIHIGIRIGRDKSEITEALHLLQHMAANIGPGHLLAYARNILLLARLDTGDYNGIQGSNYSAPGAWIPMTEDDDGGSDAIALSAVLNALAQSYCLQVRGNASESWEICSHALKSCVDMVSAQKSFARPIYQVALETRAQQSYWYMRVQIALARNDIQSASNDLLGAIQNSYGSSSSFRVRHLLGIYFCSIGKAEEAMQCFQLAAQSQSSELREASVLCQALLLCESEMDNSGYYARNKINELPQTAVKSSLLSLVVDLVSVIVEYALTVSTHQSADRSLADRLDRIIEANDASFQSQQITGMAIYILGCLYHQWGALEKAKMCYERATVAGGAAADDFLLRNIVNQSTSIYQAGGDIEREMENFDLQQKYTERIMENIAASQNSPAHHQILDSWRKMSDIS